MSTYVWHAGDVLESPIVHFWWLVVRCPLTFGVLSISMQFGEVQERLRTPLLVHIQLICHITNGTSGHFFRGKKRNVISSATSETSFSSSASSHTEDLVNSSAMSKKHQLICNIRNVLRSSASSEGISAHPHHHTRPSGQFIRRNVNSSARKVDRRLHGKGDLKLPWRKAGQPSHLVDVVDSDQ